MLRVYGSGCVGLRGFQEVGVNCFQSKYPTIEYLGFGYLPGASLRADKSAQRGFDTLFRILLISGF